MARGAQAEDAALHLLRRHGLTLIARNARYPGGELDLVMLDGSVLVIVEVRARRQSRYGGAVQSITARKQSHIVTATRWFLAKHPEHAQRSVRFDVVAFEGSADPQWIKNAFDGSGA